MNRENNRNFLEGKKYNIITFGCQMNEHDSETIAGMLEEEGCRQVLTKEESDITIINTCSIRENADKRFFGTLGQLKKIKEKNPSYMACVCGCMMQQQHVIDTIHEKYPWVDIIFGTHNIDRFPELLERLHGTGFRYGSAFDTSHIAKAFLQSGCISISLSSISCTAATTSAHTVSYRIREDGKRAVLPRISCMR